MPRKADAIVAELHGVLQASRIAAPYVLAAHSLGGLFCRLYAATYPGDVVGMVLVDSWQEDLPEILGPAGWAAYVALARAPPPGLKSYADLELVDFAAASARMSEAARAPPLPGWGSKPIFVTRAYFHVRWGCLPQLSELPVSERAPVPADRLANNRERNDGTGCYSVLEATKGPVDCVHQFRRLFPAPLGVVNG
jgi:pimeloyl-ACP methyl ester carboxylesterase